MFVIYAFFLINAYGVLDNNSLIQQIIVKQKGSDNNPDVYVYNGYNWPVEIEFQFTQETNIVSNPKLPARFVIPGKSEKKTFTLKPAVADQSFSYKYQYSFTIGDPKAEHQPLKHYCMPFPDGNRFRISRAFKENTAQNNEYNTYAVNILMPEGIPVCAARKGIVMDITFESFVKNIGKKQIKGTTNLIRILHDDGTMGVYAHLKSGSVKVSIGQQIQEKQVLGEAGYSEESDISYLHFVIQKNKGMKLISVPFQFRGKGGQGITPVKGMVLRTDKG